MKKYFIIILSLLIGMLYLQSCNYTAPDDTDIVARVEDISITQSDIDYTKAVDGWAAELNSNYKIRTDEQILDSRIKNIVIELECKKLGIEATADEVDTMMADGLDSVRGNEDTWSLYTQFAQSLGMKDADEYFCSDNYRLSVTMQINSEKLYQNFAENIASENGNQVDLTDEYQKYLADLVDSYNVIK